MAGPGFSAYLPIGVANAGIELRWADKSLADTINYTLDATNFLAAANNDSIVTGSVSITASPDTLTIGTLTATGTTLTWPISGGVLTNPVADYAITVQFSTAGGMTINRTIWLRVWPLSPNKTFSTDLIVIAGTPGSPGAAGAAGIGVIPPQAAGYPEDGIWIANGTGVVQQAPTANLFYQTNNNLALVALAALDL